MKLRIALTTLGCKVNRADGDALVDRLGEVAVLVPFESEADIYIVNSCTVTAVADRQTRQLVYRARRRSPAARVLLTGCFPKVAPKAAAELAGVDRAFTLGEHDALARYIEELAREAGRAIGPSPSSPRGRPFLKVQDGCDRACSYCIVPRARGPSRSRPVAEVLAAIDVLAREGFSEVVLSGIHLGDYGRDLSPACDLATLVRQARGCGPRLRLSSIEPDEVSDALVEEILTGAVCPHLHLPIQSGDDGILAAMNRPYRIQRVWELLADLRARLPEAALGADLIVGFPGEDEVAFAHSLELVERSPLTHLHIFPFSVRPGTPAAALPGRVSPEVAKARAATLRTAGRAKLEVFAATQAGARREVVIEERDEAGLAVVGTTENYLRATLRTQGELRSGQRVQVVIEGARGAALDARLAPTATS
jgi:threonylcarbamoyladenosine tRNA methylthiotransferase MtaB